MNTQKCNKTDSGTIEINGIPFVWHIYKAPFSKPNYKELIKVFLVDPETGKYMQNSFLRGKASDRILAAIGEENARIAEKEQEKSKFENGNPQISSINQEILKMTKEVARLTEKFNKIMSSDTHFDIFSSAYLRENEVSNNIVEQKVHELAMKLYCQNEAELINKLKIAPKAGNFTANQLLNLYGKNYYKALPKCSADTLKSKQRTLTLFCEELAATPISQVSQSQLEEVFKNQRYAKKKGLIEDFLDFCLKKGAYEPPNPVSEYFAEHFVEKSKVKRQYPTTIKHLEEEIEKNLHQLIIDHLDDYEIMALILAKCAYVSIPACLKMNWGTLVEYNGTIIYAEKKFNTVSPMQNFARPVLREGAELILEIRHRLLQKYSEEKLNNMPIIPHGDEKCSLSTHLTQYIRDMLRKAGLRSNDINKVAPGTRDIGGAGVALLKLHYGYVLSERCGVIKDSPDWRYLHGMVSADITSTHYRSLSDPISGIPYFCTIMRRDDIFASSQILNSNKNSNKIPGEKLDDTTLRYTVPAYGAGYLSHGSIPDTFVKKGTEIIISNDTFGVTGHLNFTLAGPSAPNLPSEKKDLY